MFRHLTSFISFILFSLSASTVMAADGETRNCKAETPAIFEQIGANSAPDNDSKSLHLVKTCMELEKPESYVSIPQSEWRIEKDLSFLAKITDGQKKEFLADFGKFLGQAEKISEKNERIAKAYEVATKLFPAFDERKVDLKLPKNPNSLRAALVAHALDKVRKNRAEYSIELIVVNEKDDEKRKTWVRVGIPRPGQGADIVFDFDPSSTGVVPARLVKLHSGLPDTERESLKSDCERASACLSELSMKDPLPTEKKKK